MMIQIQTIMGRSEQGISEPFHCMAADGREYFVKGLHAGRAGQINEWLCGCMAQAVGLPVAPFALLEIGEDLYDELTREFSVIGKGACFGPLAQQGCSLFEISDIPRIPPKLRRQIAAFDWFVRNEDRSAGNSNLLYRLCDNPLVVIDHNLAFDKDFNAGRFLQNHIFSADFQPVFSDWVLQTELEDWLMPALPAYAQACHNLPDIWQWANLEADVPAAYDFSYTDSVINRLSNGQLWSRP